jgi:hemerythrin-like domain-containing protein
VRTEEISFNDVSAYFAWDHDRLDGILEDTDRMVADGELERADHTFAEFVDGLRRHIRLEEDVIFPIFSQRSGVAGGPIQVMRVEHAQVLRTLEDMRQALDRQDAARYRAGRAELGEVLPAHNAKEERVLYPLIDSLLQDGEAAVLVGRMRAA